MGSSAPEEDRDRPLDELAPALRGAVERIVSDSPPEDLSQRIIEGLRHHEPPAVRHKARRLAVYVALAAAACLGGVLLVRQFRPVDVNEGQFTEDEAPVDPAESEEPKLELAADSFPPTLWAYHQAARQSPEDLDSLLDQHAEQLALSVPESLRMGVSFDLN